MRPTPTPQSLAMGIQGISDAFRTPDPERAPVTHAAGSRNRWPALHCQDMAQIPGTIALAWTPHPGCPVNLVFK